MSLLLLLSLACRTKDVSVDTGGLVDTGTFVDEDGDGVGAAQDCDDSDAAIFPDAEEICDGVDNDCDGVVDTDAVDAETWYIDSDGDGFGSGAGTTACEPPFGTVATDGDCDDGDTAYYPGAPEDDCADPADYNCDGSVGYEDADGDGYAACEECDDSSADISPDAEEICDGQDNDCNGFVDEATAIDAGTWYADSDADGYGDPDNTELGCDAPSGYLDNDQDCDDTSADVNPSATEICNSVDDDCNGSVDDDAVDAPTWYTDADADSYGNPDSSVRDCSQPTGAVADATDCDDADASINPAGSEVCNTQDDDCDSVVDEDASDASTWYSDSDSDGYGDAASTVAACTQPSGAVGNALDCDDASAAVSPAATELCNSIDDDCDGTVDNDDAADALTWYIDYDSDGYGSITYTTTACDQPSGWVSDSTDCLDSDATVNPAGTEVCNSVDDDCDGTVDNGASDATDWYPDTDCDGYGDDSSSATSQCTAPSGYVDDNTDCDDADSVVNVSAYEVCDSADTDCDGTADNDCSDPTIIASPTGGSAVDSPTQEGACALIGELSTGLDTHDYTNLGSFMTALDALSSTYAVTETASELDYSNRCGTDYVASAGNYSPTTSWPSTISTDSQGASRFRGYLNIGCEDPLSYTIGLMGNDALSLSIEGSTLMTVNWNDGEWKKFRYITFPEPGLYAFEVQWSTNNSCSIDPFELVWAEGFVSGYDDYDTMCSGSSCTYGTGVNIPGFSVLSGDSLVQSTTGASTSCTQCATTSDCSGSETCNSAGICE
ncbi:MAG: hypothetical protein ACI9VR_002383 [Cognaticolwellia sp.]|jgi:hypothetical protein